MDSDLEPGFPIVVPGQVSGYFGGPGLNVLVGDVDGDPPLELLFTGLGSGPIYGYEADGRALAGWPLPQVAQGWMTLAELDVSHAGREIVVGYVGSELDLVPYRGDGSAFRGWDSNKFNYARFPPATADIDGNGIDEIFIDGERGELYGYYLDGSLLPGWPATGAASFGGRACPAIGAQDRGLPAVADLDGDGSPEILAVTGFQSTAYGPSACLTAMHLDGSTVEGFPFNFSAPDPLSMFTAVGDVDGDGELEIILRSTQFVVILSRRGEVERMIHLYGDPGAETAPALADLDGDRIPEIIVQADDYVHAIRGDGTPMPGWPFPVGDRFGLIGNSAPMVADVDGDLQPDVVFMALPWRGGTDLWVLDRFGRPHSGFPKAILATGGSPPSLADIDGDGTNEIVITGGPVSEDPPGQIDRVWAFDLGSAPHGAIHWGQVGGSERRTGLYKPQKIAGAPEGDLAVSAASPPIRLTPGESAIYEVSVNNLGPASVVKTSVTLVAMSGLEITGATIAGIACDGAAQYASCPLGNLQTGTSRAIAIKVRAMLEGPAGLKASVLGFVDDEVSGNNSLLIEGTVRAAPTPPSSGGGAWSWIAGWGLLLAWLTRIQFPDHIVRGMPQCFRAKDRRVQRYVPDRFQGEPGAMKHANQFQGGAVSLLSTTAESDSLKP